MGTEHGHPHQITDFLVQTLRAAHANNSGAQSDPPNACLHRFHGTKPCAQARICNLASVEQVSSRVWSAAAGQRSLFQRAASGHLAAADSASTAADAADGAGTSAPVATLSTDSATINRALKALAALQCMLQSSYNRTVFVAAGGVSTVAALLDASHARAQQVAEGASPLCNKPMYA